MTSLQDRIAAHDAAFCALLDVIPARRYFSSDGSSQWHRKKQSREQSAMAKRAKLDPESGGLVSAGDVVRGGVGVPLLEVEVREGGGNRKKRGRGGGDKRVEGGSKKARHDGGHHEALEPIDGVSRAGSASPVRGSGVRSGPTVAKRQRHKRELRGRGNAATEATTTTEAAR